MVDGSIEGATGGLTPERTVEGALLTFFSGGVTVVLASLVVSRPFSYFCVLLGGISLLVLLSVFFYGLVLGTPSPLEVIGSVGVGRWVAYPLLIWVPTFGGYRLGGSVADQ